MICLECQKLRDQLVDAHIQIRALKKAEYGTRPQCLIFGFSQMQERVFSTLLTRPMIRFDNCEYIFDGALEYPENVLGAHICNINKKLFKHGVRVQNKHGVGYFFSPEDKLRIKEILECHQNPEDKPPPTAL